MSGPFSSSTEGRFLLSDNLTDEYLGHILPAFIRHIRGEFTPSPSLTIAVGFDGRNRSKDFALLDSEIISKSGLGVLRSSGIVPLPALSLAAKQHGCAAGIMITGGSSPSGKIGIEFKQSSGAPFSNSALLKIAKLISEPDATPSGIPASHLAGISEIDFLTDYESYLRSSLDISALTTFAQNPKNNANVLIDSMGGAGQTIIEEILVSCGWRAQTLFGAPQPDFFDRHPKPNSANLSALRYNVKVIDAQMGIATDGDGGGCGIILENGDWLDIQTMTLILLWHQLKQKKKRGNFLRSPIIPEAICRAIQTDLMSVIEMSSDADPNEIWKPGWFLGVSDEGDFSFGPDLPERDGILTGLQFAEMVSISGKSLRMLIDVVGSAVGGLGGLPSKKRD